MHLLLNYPINLLITLTDILLWLLFIIREKVIKNFLVTSHELDIPDSYNILYNGDKHGCYAFDILAVLNGKERLREECLLLSVK